MSLDTQGTPLDIQTTPLDTWAHPTLALELCGPGVLLPLATAAVSWLGGSGRYISGMLRRETRSFQQAKSTA